MEVATEFTSRHLDQQRVAARVRELESLSPEELDEKRRRACEPHATIPQLARHLVAHEMQVEMFAGLGDEEPAL